MSDTQTVDVGTEIDVSFTTEDVRDARDEVADRQDEMPIIDVNTYAEEIGSWFFPKSLVSRGLRSYIGLGKPRAWTQDNLVFADLKALFSNTERDRFVKHIRGYADELSGEAKEEIQIATRGKARERLIGIGFRPDDSKLQDLDEDSPARKAAEGWALGVVAYQEPDDRITRDEVFDLGVREFSAEFFSRGGRYAVAAPPEREAFHLAVGMMLLSDIAFRGGGPEAQIDDAHIN